MAGFLYKSPSIQLVDANGDVYPGAKLNFYLTGTSTQSDSYTDSALGTPHTNPVIADSAGLFAPIYIDPNVSYKVVYTDTDDVVLQTIDPVGIDLGTGNVPFTDLTPAADKVPYYTGATTGALADFTSYGRSIVATANEAGFKALVNLETGTDVQAWDAHLDDLAAISPAIGDIICFDGSNWVKLLAGTDKYILQANGPAVPTWVSPFNNRAYVETTSLTTISSVIPYDNTIPQITEGTEILTTTLTPTTTLSRLRFYITIKGSARDVNPVQLVMAVFDGNTNAIAAAMKEILVDVSAGMEYIFEYVPGVTVSTTFSVRLGVVNSAGSRNYRVNGDGAGTQVFGGVSRTNMIIEEIA